MIDAARVDHVARVILENLGGDRFTDEEWSEILCDEEEREFIDSCRQAARAAIAAADQVTGAVQ